MELNITSRTNRTLAILRILLSNKCDRVDFSAKHFGSTWRCDFVAKTCQFKPLSYCKQDHSIQLIICNYLLTREFNLCALNIKYRKCSNNCISLNNLIVISLLTCRTYTQVRIEGKKKGKAQSSKLNTFLLCIEILAYIQFHTHTNSSEPIFII